MNSKRKARARKPDLTKKTWNRFCLEPLKNINIIISKICKKLLNNLWCVFRVVNISQFEMFSLMSETILAIFRI